MHALILQMDEEEKYNRRLESGLYTLQVRYLFWFPPSVFIVNVNSSV